MIIRPYYKKITMVEDEEIEFVIVQHPLAKGHLMLLGLMLLFLPFFFMFTLFEKGSWGVAVFISLFVIAVIFLSREYYMWKYNCFVVTNKKIVDIDQKGLFHKIVSEVPYAKILDVSYQSKGMIQSLLGIGDITITTSIPQVSLFIRHVPDVKLKVADLVTLVDARADRSHKELTRDQKFSALDEVMHDEVSEYEDYSLKELVEEYTDMYSVTKLKKLLIEQLSRSADDEVDTEDTNSV